METKRETIQPGDKMETWCSQHGDLGKKTEHIWTGTRLVCLECDQHGSQKSAANGS